MTHSIIPPSSAHVWTACPGWVTMSQCFPQTDETEAQREGTLAHDYAARLISSHARANSEPVNIDDDEMREAVEMYAGNVREVMLQTGVLGGHAFGIEQPLKMGYIHDLSFGTPDCFLFDAKNLTVYLWDFKFGYDPVEAFRNWQLINYAPGVVAHLQAHTPLLSDTKLKFVFRIVQPRAFHRDGPIREWVVSHEELRPYIDSLREKATEALLPDAPTQSGAHCKYCPARHACPSALQAATSLYEVAGQSLPLDISIEAQAVQLRIVRRAAKHLEAIKEALEQQIESHIRAGKHVPGFAVAQKLGRQKWSVDIEQVVALGDMFGVDLRKNDAVTPKQAIKLGIDESVINGYSQKTSSGIEIVEDDGSKAQHIFGVL